MGDWFAQACDLFRERIVCIGWLAGLLLLIGVYALGYLCAILPSLANRRRNRLLAQCAALRSEILEKICEYGELYNQYVRESDSSRRASLAEQITGLRESVKGLEFRLASLEERKPRVLPLRPLPVARVEIE